MPYRSQTNFETSGFKPIQKILQNRKIDELKKRLKVKNADSEANKIKQIAKPDFRENDLRFESSITIDGSFYANSVQDAFPSIGLGYVTISVVQIFTKKIKELEKKDFIDPHEYQKLEISKTIEMLFPGENVLIDDAKNEKEAIKRSLLEQLNDAKIYEDGETLLDTCEHLAKLEFEIVVNRGVDALRLHEAYNPIDDCVDMNSQIMTTMERLSLANVLRYFEKKEDFDFLSKNVFIVDGPISLHGNAAWLNKVLKKEFKRINEIQKQKTGKDLIILGIEKTGLMMDYFEMIDIDKNDKNGKIPKKTAFQLTDEFIKKNIFFANESENLRDIINFGKKFFYKASNGYKIVCEMATFDESGDDDEKNFFEVLEFLDRSVCDQYQNSIIQLVSAHKEAAISSNLGEKFFNEILMEIRNSKLN